MGILGIENRTENWKTTQHLHCLSGEAKSSLVYELGERPKPQGHEVQLELFWHGGRDYFYGLNEGRGRSPEEKGSDDDRLAACYQSLFPSLLENLVSKGRGLTVTRPWNYNPSYGGYASKLRTNIESMEIDIVLETHEHLFIGEAKYEMDGFGTKTEYVLVHQLIREFVMARIVAKMVAEDSGSKPRTVVPFVVVDESKLVTIKNRKQVQFMVEQEWLKDANILTWEGVRELTGQPRVP